MADVTYVTHAMYLGMMQGALVGTDDWLVSPHYIGLLKDTGSPPVWNPWTTSADVVSQEADYTSYSRSGFLHWGTADTDAQHRAYTNLGSYTFTTPHGAFTGNIIIGWFVWNSSTTEITMYKIFDPANYIDFTLEDQSLTVIPTLKFFDASIAP